MDVVRSASGSIRWAAKQIGSGGGVIRFAPVLDDARIVLGGSVSPGGRMWVEGPAEGITITGRPCDSDDPLVSLKNVAITKGYAAAHASATHRPSDPERFSTSGLRYEGSKQGTASRLTVQTFARLRLSLSGSFS